MKVICNLIGKCKNDELKCDHREEHEFIENECLNKICHRLESMFPKKYEKIIQEIECKPVFIELVKDTIKKHNKKHKNNGMQ